MRAKFTVESVRYTADGADVEMLPVINGSKENESFYKWTPAGRVSLSLVSHETADKLTPGAEFYVDFTPAS